MYQPLKPYRHGADRPDDPLRSVHLSVVVKSMGYRQVWPGKNGGRNVRPCYQSLFAERREAYTHQRAHRGKGTRWSLQDQFVLVLGYDNFKIAGIPCIYARSLAVQLTKMPSLDIRGMIEQVPLTLYGPVSLDKLPNIESEKMPNEMKMLLSRFKAAIHPKKDGHFGLTGPGN